MYLRVPREDIIYHGVSKDPFYPDMYCESRADPMHASRGQCVCSKDMENLLVETCDIDTSEHREIINLKLLYFTQDNCVIVIISLNYLIGSALLFLLIY